MPQRVSPCTWGWLGSATRNYLARIRSGMEYDQRFEQGKIAEAWVHYDALGMMQQLGMAQRALPRPPARAGARVDGVTQSRR